MNTFPELFPTACPRSLPMIDKDIFEDLFVLEIANNHLGSVGLHLA